MKRTTQRARVSASLAWIATAALLAGCGGGDADKAATTETGKSPAKARPERETADDPDARLANAVIVGKTAAPVMLKYDVPVKPEVGVPFEVTLTFLTRREADSLTADVSGMTGLAVLEGVTARFEPVEAGGRHTARVLAKADASGIYYLGVVAKVATKVQTEGRTFSVPVVVGVPAPVQKPAPATDSSGAPVESLPATETTDPGSDDGG